MDPSRRPADVVNVNAIIRFLNAFSESLQFVQQVVGTEAMAIFIPTHWIDSRYVRDPDLRSNIIVCQETAQGTIYTSTDCSILISQLKDLVESLSLATDYELPSYLNI